MQRRGDRGAIRLESVRGDLERSRGRSLPHAFDERVSGALIALTHGDIQHQLGMPLNRNKSVAVAKVLIVLGTDVLFLLSDKTPNLIALHVAHLDITDLLSHDALRFLASEYQEFQNRGVVNFSDPLDGRNAGTFQQKPENHLGLLDGQVHTAQRYTARLRECSLALKATKAQASVAIFSESLAFEGTGGADHLDLDLSSGPVQNGSGPNNPSSGFGLRLNPVGSFNYLPGFVFVTQPQRGHKKSVLILPFHELPRHHGRQSLTRVYPTKRRLDFSNIFTLDFPADHATQYHNNCGAWVFQPSKGIGYGTQFFYDVGYGDVAITGLQYHSHGVSKSSVLYHGNRKFGHQGKLLRQRLQERAHRSDDIVQFLN